MTHRIMFRLFFVAMLLVVATALFAQGLYFESTMQGGPMGDQPRLSKAYLMPKMVKQIGGMGGPGASAMIMRLDQEKMYQVNYDEKTYSEMTFTEIEKAVKDLSAQSDKQMADMAEHMKSMPEAQRKMMEQMMGKKGGNVTMEKTGEKMKVSGYDCTKFVAKDGDKVLMTMWATRDVKGFDALRKDYEAVMSRMMSMTPGGMQGLVEAMNKVDGFPMQSEWAGMTTTVTKVVAQATPAAEFAVPAGFTKVDSPMKKKEGK